MGKREQKVQTLKKNIKRDPREVTCEKRLATIFKMGSELVTLYGVDIVIIVFSPTGEVYTFGRPSVECVRERFFAQSPPPNAANASDSVDGGILTYFLQMSYISFLGVTCGALFSFQ